MRLPKLGRYDRNNNESGSSFIEIAIASVALGVIVFIGLDAYVWTQAFMINDLACRDACRAAAQATSTINTVAAYKTHQSSYFGPRMGLSDTKHDAAQQRKGPAATFGTISMSGAYQLVLHAQLT